MVKCKRLKCWKSENGQMWEKCMSENGMKDGTFNIDITTVCLKYENEKCEMLKCWNYENSQIWEKNAWTKMDWKTGYSI